MDNKNEPYSSGARVVYANNILSCNQHRTFEENLAVCKAALCMLTGIDYYRLFESNDELMFKARGKIDRYRTT